MKFDICYIKTKPGAAKLLFDHSVTQSHSCVSCYCVLLQEMASWATQRNMSFPTSQHCETGCMVCSLQQDWPQAQTHHSAEWSAKLVQTQTAIIDCCIEVSCVSEETVQQLLKLRNSHKIWNIDSNHCQVHHHHHFESSPRFQNVLKAGGQSLPLIQKHSILVRPNWSNSSGEGHMHIRIKCLKKIYMYISTLHNSHSLSQARKNVFQLKEFNAFLINRIYNLNPQQHSCKGWNCETHTSTPHSTLHTTESAEVAQALHSWTKII